MQINTNVTRVLNSVKNEVNYKIYGYFKQASIIPGKKDKEVSIEGNNKIILGYNIRMFRKNQFEK